MDMRARLRLVARRYEQAKAARDAAIREAAQEGMSRRQIGELVKLSSSRVQQIVRGE